ncbi:MAG: site-specific DNA-methyltransferase, partial [Anaerolineaceae bacterium]|nr:site-specific DNA-methyltransferase [Anaerolineaceae bacterium]
SPTGNPRKIIFADDVVRAGIKVQDIWRYKDPQNPRYPTEKNIDMLKMIVSASSNPGDIVLDAFCGSGTTLVAAQELQRKWIGIDSSSEAIAICKQRLMQFDYIDLTEGAGTQYQHRAYI